MLRKGFIGPTEALTRLENLGIAQPDQMLLLSEAEAAIASDAADLAAAKDMALKKQIKEMDRLREKNAANLRGIAARMRQLTPPKQLAEWVARGEWDQDDAVNRLTLMGYDTGSINVLLADAARDKAGGPVSDDAKSQRIAVNLRRLTPPDKVTAWYRDGIWSEKQTRQRLALLGFPPDVIDAMIKEAEHQRPEAPAP